MSLRRGALSFAGTRGPVAPVVIPVPTVLSTFLFNGTNQDVTIPDSDDFTVDDLYIGVWLYPTGTGQYSIIRNRSLGAGGTAPGFAIEINSGQISSNSHYEDDAGNFISPSVNFGSVPANQWSFIELVHDGASLTFHINRAEATYTPATSGVPASSNSANPILVGSIDSGRYFKGSMSQPIISNTLKSNANRDLIYNSGQPRAYDILSGSTITGDVVAYSMTSSDSTLTDLTGNGNDGTNGNSIVATGQDLTFLANT